MSSKGSLRVYFVPHGEPGKQLLHGTLIRSWDALFDQPSPTSIGANEADVLAHLEQQLLARMATGEDSIERYLWEEEFGVREVKVEIHPLSSVKKRPVIGKQSIELTISYAHCAMPGGGHRIMIPRFGGWFVVEEHQLAPVLLRHAISSWLLGAEPKNLYDFRYEGPEWVRAWAPRLLDRLPDATKPDGDEVDFPTMTRVGDDWVATAARGKLGAFVGESVELEALGAKLARPVPPSLLIVGPPSVGKTTLVRRIAKALSQKKRATGERARRMWATNAEKILAGMVYLGMWQERCIQMVHELEGEGDYLYVGPLLPLLRPQPDGSTIAEMFESAVLADSMSIIAECTPAELERAERLAPGFVGHFHIVRVEEPSETATLQIVQTYAERKGLASFHPAGARLLVQLLGTFMKSLAFPGKAIRFIDWMAQRERPSAEVRAEERPPLLARDVARLFSKHSGIPVDVLSDEVALTVDTIASRLGNSVIGQEAACRACARIVTRFKANLADPERPFGSLLFVGPTGVGKTELAKQLARLVYGDDRKMIRLDMSEYGTAGAVHHLMDSSAGVRSLARAVAEEPLSVVLLDEIEKAHASVFDLLLGILGEGRLTDAAGRLVDFRGTIVVMTSNLGARDAPAIGFGERGRDFGKAVREHFRPEFVARLDDVVPFAPLGRDHVVAIVRLALKMLAERKGLTARGIRLEASDAAVARLADLGYEPARGARPLKRVLEERVVVPLAATLARDPKRRDETALLRAEDEPAPKGDPGALLLRV